MSAIENRRGFWRPQIADPSAFFRTGRLGGWLDGSDTETLLTSQTSPNAQVAADGNAIAFAILKRYSGPITNGVSAERLVNGDFEAGATGWTVVNADATHIVTFASGTMRYQSDTTTPNLTVSNSSALLTSRLYRLQTTVTSYTGGTIGDAAGPQLAKALGVSYSYRQVAGTTFVMQRFSSNVDLTLGSVSAKEVSGNAAQQGTAGQRPTWKAAGYIHFDGVDDNLVATFPVAPGANCDVMYITPSGLTLLHGQNVGTSWTLPTGDIYQLVVRSVPFSASEVLQFKSWGRRKTGLAL